MEKRDGDRYRGRREEEEMKKKKKEVKLKGRRTRETEIVV